MALGLAFAFPQDASAGYGKIYIIGNDGWWNPPTLENEAFFANKVLEEVAPDVYEGVFEVDRQGYFRFITALKPESEASWYRNTICPVADGLWMQTDATNGVRSSDVVYDVKALPTTTEPGTWRIASGRYRFIVDLNTKTVRAIPEDAVLALVNDDTSVPSYANFENFSAFTKGKTYVKEGDLRFRLYDLFLDKWVNPAEGAETLTAPGAVDYVLSDTKGEAFVVPSWPGGVLSGFHNVSSEYFVNIEYDSFVNTQAPRTVSELYAIGDFCTWDFADAVKGEKLDEQGARWRVTLPAGTMMFKLTDGATWDVNFGQSFAEKLDDGSVRIYMASDNMPNFEFTEALTAALTVELDFEKMMLTMPAGAPVEVKDTYHTDYGDVMYVVTPDAVRPWKGASNAVLGNLPRLTPDGKGNYEGEFYYTGGVNFVSELGATADENVIIAPSFKDDYLLTISDGHAYARAAEVKGGEPSYFRLSQSASNSGLGSKVHVVVTPGADPVVHFTYDAMLPASDGIYLIGTPNDWDINSDEYKLVPTDNGCYYGAFDIPAADATAIGTLMFRFYTDLGNWDNGSLGWGYDDVLMTVSAEYEGTFVRQGKGSWEIPDYPGGMLYIAVNPNDMTVKFSMSPISSAGNPIENPEIGLFKTGVYSPTCTTDIENGGAIVYYNDFGLQEPGIYSGSVYSEGFMLMTRKLPISPVEPEWNGSYVLAPVNGSATEPDEFGVSEIAFERRDYVSTEAPEMFAFKTEYPYVGMCTVDFNRNIASFEASSENIYIGGKDFASGKYTLANRAELKDFYVKGAGVRYFPAGDVEFNLSQRISAVNAPSGTPVELTMQDGVSVANPNWGYNLLNFPLTLKGWTGGDLLVTQDKLYDIKTLSGVEANLYDGYEQKSYQLKRDADQELVFSLDIPYEKAQNAVSPMSIIFFATVGGEKLQFGSVSTNRPVEAMSSMANMIPVEGKVDGNVWLGSYYSFRFPTIVGSGTVRVRFDLATMTADFEFLKFETGSVYEVVSPSNPDLDGAVAYPSVAEAGVVTVEMTANNQTESDGYEFNLTNAEGDVLMPVEGQEEIVFGVDGLWTGDIRTVPAAASGRRARALAADAATAKWKFALPENARGELSLMVDEKNSKITVFSPDCNPSYFILVYGDNGTPVIVPMIENINRMPRLSPAADGKLYGRVELGDVPADGARYVQFTKNLSLSNTPYGLSPLNSDDFIVDFGASDGERTMEVLGETPFGYDTALNITLKSVGKDLDVVYDPAEGLLTLKSSTSGIENVAVESSVSITGSLGRIVVSAEADVHIVVVSLQGRVLKSLDCAAGTTSLAMPAGMYIVNNQKVIVR